MKRMIVVTMLLLGTAAAAQADTSVWTSKPPRSDAELMAAGRYCDFQVGVEQNGVPTTPAYKRCMRSQGWSYQKKIADHTWINRRGMRCQPILGGIGSECSSIW